MSEFKTTNYAIQKDNEKLILCKNCGFFSFESFFDSEFIESPLKRISKCKKCNGTNCKVIGSIYESIDIYNFFVNKINQIKEIIDVK